MKKIRLIIFIIILSSIKTFAQSSSFAVTIYGTQPDFTFSTISDYENGISLPAAVKFDVTAVNGDDWTISFKSLNSNLSSSNGSTMPLSMMKVQVEGFSSKVLSTSDQQLASDNPSNNSAQTKSYLIDYSVSAPGYNYDPASYSATILYTLTVK